MFRRRGIFLVLAIALCAGGSAFAFGPGAKGYVGSERCKECHEEIYAQWRKTPHANMLRDATNHPDAVAAKDYSGVPFTRQDIRWTIGSHWIQKYLTFIDNDYFVLPKYWNLVTGDWEPYSIFNWRQQPYTSSATGATPPGSTRRRSRSTSRRSGARRATARARSTSPSNAAADIVNPSKLAKERRDMICEACHTDGKDTRYGGQFPFPAGYRPGEDLSDNISPTSSPPSRSRRSGTGERWITGNATGCSSSGSRSSTRPPGRATSAGSTGGSRSRPTAR